MATGGMSTLRLEHVGPGGISRAGVEGLKKVCFLTNKCISPVFSMFRGHFFSEKFQF